MGPLGELGALFNPGMRHEEEEKRAKEMLREEEGTGRKGRLGVDLDSGVVVIGDDEADPDTDDATASDADDATAGRTGSAAPAGRTGSAAAVGRADAADRPDAADKSDTADKSDAADKPAPKPGVPQVANRSPASAPAGKARRAQEGKQAAPPPEPVGKAKRRR